LDCGPIGKAVLGYIRGVTVDDTAEPELLAAARRGDEAAFEL
jgi:hypothetical protein